MFYKFYEVNTWKHKIHSCYLIYLYKVPGLVLDVSVDKLSRDQVYNNNFNIAKAIFLFIPYYKTLQKNKLLLSLTIQAKSGFHELSSRN